VDRVEVTAGSSVGRSVVSVLFLATLEGVIHKLVVFPSDAQHTPQVCLVEAINLSETPRPGLVRSLQLHAAKVVTASSTTNVLFNFLSGCQCQSPSVL